MNYEIGNLRTYVRYYAGMDKKRCNKCGVVKPLTEFYRTPGMRDGHRNDCKACNLAAKAARYRANPGPAKDRAKRWAREHADLVAARRREYHVSGKKRVANRKSHLKRTFGISPEDYDRLLAQQGGVCRICTRPPRQDISLHVDHDHESGRIRGLLCFRCNNALGDFDDDPALLRAAATYLEGPPVREPELERRLQELKRLVAGGTR